MCEKRLFVSERPALGLDGGSARIAKIIVCNLSLPHEEHRGMVAERWES